MRTRAFFICFTALVLMLPAEAWACSCGGVQPVVYSADGEIPADFGGIAIWPGDAGFDATNDPFVRIERWVGDAWVEEDAYEEVIQNPGGFERYGHLAFLKPTPFESADRFRVHAGFETAPVNPIQVEIEVGPPLPDVVGEPSLALGEVVAKTLSVRASGSCDEQVWSTTRTVRIGLPEGLEPYRDLLFYETTIDGNPWRPVESLCSPNPIGRSWQDEPGTDLLATACAYPFHEWDTGLLEESSFTVQVHAYFPGTTHPVWSTPEVQTELTCRTDCVEYQDDELVPCADDGGPDPDAAGDDGGPDPDAAGDDDRGCATTDSDPAPWLILLAALGFLRLRLPGDGRRNG